MDTKKEKKNILSNGAVQTLLASLFCIILGLVVGYVVLLVINPQGAGRAITAILQNFLYFPRPEVALEYFGSTLAKTAPLLMCTLSVLFAYKVGLFNIGASGQYAVGAGFALYFGIHYGAPWWLCLLLAMLGGAALGAIAGALKAYLNVNEVIACIMLNWISLYAVNTVLTEVKESGTTYTLPLRTNNPNALIPHLGLQHLFADNRYVTIAIPLAVIFAILVWVVLDKTKLGYELKATGLSINAAKYAGIKVGRSMVLSMTISGALAGLAGVTYYLGYVGSIQPKVLISTGFDAIAVSLLGNNNPFGIVFSTMLITLISKGSTYMKSAAGVDAEIASVITGIILLFSACNAYIKWKMERNRREKTNKTKEDK